MTSCGQCPRGGGVVNVPKAEGDDVTRAMAKGGGWLVNVPKAEGDDVTWAMSKGGCL